MILIRDKSIKNKIAIQLKEYRIQSNKTGTYQFTNIQESPDFGGTIDQSGDYIGFSLGIHFKKKKNEK